jgi:rubrerythrin
MSDIEVESIEQLLAIALSAERSAARRYTDISAQMRESGNRELADLFSRIAGVEREHANEVEQMIQALGIKDLPAAPAIAWQHPQVRDDRDRATSPGTSTPYLALAYAVNNEELAFRFYSYVAANTKDREVRRFAEVFAKEELAHADLFREQRRRAYHEQRARTDDGQMPVPDEIRSVEGLVNAASQIEKGIRELLVAAESRGLDVSKTIYASNELIEQLGVDQARLSREAGGEPTSEGESAADSVSYTDSEDILRAIARSAERAFMFYDSVTASARDEDTMVKAQALTEKALDRINALQSLSDA